MGKLGIFLTSLLLVVNLTKQDRAVFSNVDFHQLLRLSENSPSKAEEILQKWTSTQNELSVTAFQEMLASKAAKTPSKCLTDSLTILDNILENNKSNLWALRYFDAWGKLPAGFLAGAFKFYGDFDECLDIGQPQNVEFSSKYCRIGLSLRTSGQDSEDSHESIREFFVGLWYGICLPDSCSESEIAELSANLAKKIGLNIRDVVCYVPNLEKTSLFMIAITVFVVAGLFMLIGLLIDVALRLRKNGSPKLSPDETYTIQGHFASLLLCFSPLSNFEKLMTIPAAGPTDGSKPNLSCLNAVRTLSLFWVVLGHIYATQLFYLTENSIVIFESIKNVAFQFIIAGVFAVDTFFFLSGFLAYYSIEKIVNSVKYEKRLSNFWKSLPIIYIHRYLRLTPAVGAAMLIDLGFWPYLHNGPFYFQKQDTACLNGWWANLLYVHNYVNKVPCIGWVWYLAIDMQLFIVAPFVVYLLANTNDKKHTPAVWGWAALGLGFIIQFVGGIATTVIYNLPIASQFPGMDPSKNYASYSTEYYSSTNNRMGPYVVGILFAHLIFGHFTWLRSNLFSRRLAWLQAVLWVLTLGMLLTLTYGLYDFYNAKMTLSIEVEALYNATARCAWAAAIGWIVMACLCNRAGIIGNILSWPGWALPARLSYSAYLLHIFVILFFFQTSRRPFYLTEITTIYLYLGVIFSTMIVSIPFSLAFESPVINLLHFNRK